MRHKSDIPEPDTRKLSLEEVMLAARVKARAEAAPIATAQRVSQLRIRGVFGELPK